ncbi:UDP-N-acetyl-alpha-D-glucosamine C6 dehydratase [Neobacillus rhizosphaerae]|uniref:UDP-N-acetyl-alpha-D-glucosamine C6 dehydratase n=1 Tax=Neobacillus rhizosphaerae TaxID=2880965 RepID=A0ABN8KW30_9BACI|nr:nucleoside-diphosphate sugar epimerase/dehydratase [Neobacillus rhizosphaerae]CAH2716765.1 UDP-N-acetyl-alpha-D-glucosamine C6 dehydratase [Neobacillus rhizosphaerae]
MAYKTRLVILCLLDSILVLTALYLSYYPLHPSIIIHTNTDMMISGFTLVVSHFVFASYYRLYHKAWEYASVNELLAIVKAVTFSVLTMALVQYIIDFEIYFRALLTTWNLYVLSVGGSRFVWRMIRDTYFKTDSSKKRTLIIGAGAAGVMVVRQLQQNADAELMPVAFIDDDPRKFKLQFLNIQVFGDTKQIMSAVKELKIDNIVIAIPSLEQEELSRIFDECAKTKVKTQILPMLEDLMTGKVSVNQFREVQVEHLLGREPVELDISRISENITGRTVLVTGAGGSIGSEICRQICKFTPAKLVLVGHGENSIYLIDMELRNKYQNQIEIVPVIGDIQDRARMFDVMEEHRPFVVYHAAAHKHVPLMEYNPREAVKNNIFGTKNVAEAADTFGVSTFVMISSDKAVNPTNVMGATKRFAEMIIQSLAQNSKTKFVAVRFGNVLGSRGSVIPLFKKQIQAGGPVTVTHPDMTRYFMTIPEASRLVIQAGVLARGGEVFVLDMGEPVKIVDLAKNLIKLSGYTIEEIGIQFSGLRPGEKMYEELLNENEVHPEQVYPKIHIGKAKIISTEKLRVLINSLLDMSEAEMHETLIAVANNRFDGATVLYRAN